MRMGCLFASGTFWGVLLIFLGILLIIRVIFNINIPVFRILFALLLIYFGIRILVGGWWRPPAPEWFREPRAAVAAGNEYRVVFGKGVIDLTGVEVSSATVHKTLRTVFGSATVKINPQTPVMLSVEAAFSSARLPDGNVVSFGHYTYTSRAYREGAPCLFIDAHAAFGELSIVESGGT